MNIQMTRSFKSQRCEGRGHEPITPGHKGELSHVPAVSSILTLQNVNALPFARSNDNILLGENFFTNSSTTAIYRLS